ncbi:uncharacterized protein IUM83_17841 [Phytophthora cinnamomi]|uniref:uncharacterized protein n=1 Tax=Phytophthora cinnamomi TaxID=4785 RepID=UPI00355A155C|nr:hypothetical protein IUM83_17841 [Phytophthora cinnamomi]
MAGDAGSAAALPLVGKKLMSRLGGMANESAAAEVSDFARRQMEKMGWSAGKGLGKNEQGVKSHVKVKRREELQGVGAEKKAVQEQGNQWWYNVYDRMASKIVVDASSDEEGEGSSEKQKKKKKKDKKKDKKRKRLDENESPNQKFRIPTDEELFAATGGKLFGRRAYGSCKGKLKRDEMQLKKARKEEKDSEEETPVTTGSDSEEEEDKEKMRKKKKKEARKLKKKNKKEKKDKKDDGDSA